MNTMELREAQRSPGPDSAGLHNQSALTQTCQNSGQNGRKEKKSTEAGKKEKKPEICQFLYLKSSFSLTSKMYSPDLGKATCPPE